MCNLRFKDLMKVALSAVRSLVQVSSIRLETGTLLPRDKSLVCSLSTRTHTHGVKLVLCWN